MNPATVKLISTTRTICIINAYSGHLQKPNRTLLSFVKERAGHGTGENTAKYKYVVEKLSSGEKVYLTRPAYKSRGFDFIIHVKGHVFLNGKNNPKHEDILEDLKNKKQSHQQAYEKLLEALENVFYCNDPNDIYPNYKHYLTPLDMGIPPELILKVVKWFFIEQDIRYWNWSGCNMFMKGIKDI